MPSRVTIERLGNPRVGAVAGRNKSLEGLCIALVALGKKLCPVDEGLLRNSTMAKGPGFEYGFNESAMDKAPGDQRLDLPTKEGTAVFGTASDHWYPEFGTSRQAAQPFIRPAAELLVQGQSAADIVRRYSAAEMERQLKHGIRQFKEYKSGEAVPPGLQA